MAGDSKKWLLLCERPARKRLSRSRNSFVSSGAVAFRIIEINSCGANESLTVAKGLNNLTVTIKSGRVTIHHGEMLI